MTELSESFIFAVMKMRISRKVSRKNLKHHLTGWEQHLWMLDTLVDTCAAALASENYSDYKRNKANAGLRNFIFVLIGGSPN